MRLCKQEEDKIALKKCLRKHYLLMKNMFLMVASNSNYPCIGLNDYYAFVNRSGVIDKHLNQAAIDINLAATNVSTNPYKNSSERELHRYEFIEVIVRCANSKYKEPKIIRNLPIAVDEILKECIIPNNPKVDGVTWRWAHLYTLSGDDFWKKNQPCVVKLFESFLNPTKRYVTMEEAFKMCRKANI